MKVFQPGHSKLGRNGQRDATQRSREYLTDREVEGLIEAAKQNRSGHRDDRVVIAR